MNKPVIERIDHAAINVTDIRRAMKFYGDVLGLTEVPRPKSFDFPGAWYQVGENGSATVHLVERNVADPSTTSHFALWTQDIQQAAEYIKNSGYPIDWSAHKIEGINRFFVRDPDGNLVELQGSDGEGNA